MSLLLSLLCRHRCRPHHRLYRHLAAWNNTFSLHSHYASPTADSEAKNQTKKAEKHLTSCFQKSARMLKTGSFTRPSTDRCLLFHVHQPPSVSSPCFWQCDKGRNLPTCCWTRRRWVVELPSSVSSREKRWWAGRSARDNYTQYCLPSTLSLLFRFSKQNHPFPQVKQTT